MGFKESLNKIVHHEEPIEYPLPEEIEEGGLVEPWREPLVGGFQHEEEMTPGRPIDLNPYEANQVRHWEQRRRARRTENTGRKKR